MVGTLMVAIAGSAVGTALARSASKSTGGRPTARFVVAGTAPRGVIVSYADSKSPTRVIESGSVPLNASVSKKGVSFYKFRARLFSPGVHITCTIRIGSVVEVRHASGTNSLCVVSARPPGGPSSAGGPDQASFGLKAPPKPAVTAAMVAAAHRDELRMLKLFVPPSGAQRISREPVLLRRLGRQIFGDGPTSSDKYARFGYWRVRSSVAAVARFVLAHQPPGHHEGCGDAPSTPLDRLCGVGLDTAANLPANASLLFVFHRIPGLVSDRELRVSILSLPGHWTAIRAAATTHTWIPARFRSRGAPLPQLFFFSAHHRPRAGQAFTGVTLIDEDPRISPLVRVFCGGVLGHRALLGAQHLSSTAPPPGRAGAMARAEKVTKVEEVTCRWKIPGGAAGQRLRLGSGHGAGARVAAYTARTGRMAAETISSPEYSWVVRP